jgi:hypothetical protein
MRRKSPSSALIPPCVGKAKAIPNQTFSDLCTGYHQIPSGDSNPECIIVAFSWLRVGSPGEADHHCPRNWVDGSRFLATRVRRPSGRLPCWSGHLVVPILAFFMMR